ncbi:MAG: right-handed parallel beta-helix repeat-containing protein, partial [Chlamydiia bacterium]|nr:right-handed parallel beta-helix repeat-containing protein [Chlamydiia bacterium]
MGQRGILIDASSRNNITIKNLTFQHSNNDNTIGSNARGAVYMYQGSYLTVSGCIFKDNSRNGLHVIDSPHLMVDNNTFLRTGQTNNIGNNFVFTALIPNMTDITFSNNICSFAGHNGCQINAGTIANRINNVDIHGNTFTYNKAAGAYTIKCDSVAVYNNTFDSNGDEAAVGEDYAFGSQGCNNIDFYNNTVTNTAMIERYNSDAVQFYSDNIESGNNIRVFRNYIDGVGTQDALGMNMLDNLTSENMEIFSNVLIGADRAGLGFYRTGPGVASTPSVYNNTFYGNMTSDIRTVVNFPMDIKNNIFGSDVLNVRAAALLSGLTTSNNLYYRASGNVLDYGGITYTTATIKTFEASAQNTDPLFTDAGNEDFTLQVGSPAINNGVDVGLTTDILGNPILGIPDIGVVEMQKKYTTEDITICDGSSYESWTTAGHYQRTLTATSGADSIVTTNLTVNPVSYVSEDIVILEGESYNGWTTSGQYERFLTASSGCDSIVTTNLSVTLNKTTTEDITICEGSSYQGWTSTGIYVRVLTATSGADSIVTTNLYVNPVLYVSEDINILEGESYQGWTTSGQYEQYLIASTGCDSIVATNLSVTLKKKLTTEDISICKGSSYEGWTSAGIYERVLKATSGADSIVTT